MKINVILFLLFQSFVSLCQPVMVRDINPGTSASIADFGVPSTSMGNVFYFIANDGIAGKELWRSDGTEAGTTLVKDIWLGTDQEGAGSFYTVYNSQLYFEGNNIENGREVWTSDGTEAGTILLTDACTGACSGPVYGNRSPEFVAYRDKLYFMSSNSTVSKELWSTDGTPAGTALAVDIYPGGLSSDPGRMHVFNDVIYLEATLSGYGRELCRTDGTTAGTALVKDISPGAFASGGAANPISLGDYFYFVASAPGSGAELWKSDGTSEGTTMVKEIGPGAAAGIGDASSRDFIVFNDKLFFIAKDGLTGYEIWSTDGTDAGTTLLKDIASGGGNSLAAFMGILNGKLIFRAHDSASGAELWSTDGTTANTTLLKDIFPGIVGSNIRADVAIHDGKMFFPASDGINGLELWQTDGTASGTSIFADISTGGASSSPSNLQIVGNTLFFFAEDNQTGRELWKLDLAPPTAIVSVPSDTTCVQANFTFEALAAGTNNTYEWNFGTGALPSTAQGIGPHIVKYSTAGVKNARLIVSNIFGKDTALQAITILPLATANFTLSSAGQTATFTNTSTNATSYLWDFGDGNSSTLANPTHTYLSPGIYSVTLKATNECNTAQKVLSTTILVGTNELFEQLQVSISPNPSKGHFQVDLQSNSLKEAEVSLFDMQGSLQKTIKTVVSGGKSLVVFEGLDLPKGNYALRIRTEAGSASYQIVIY